MKYRVLQYDMETMEWSKHRVEFNSIEAAKKAVTNSRVVVHWSKVGRYDTITAGPAYLDGNEPVGFIVIYPKKGTL